MCICIEYKSYITEPLINEAFVNITMKSKRIPGTWLYYLYRVFTVYIVVCGFCLLINSKPKNHKQLNSGYWIYNQENMCWFGFYEIYFRIPNWGTGHSKN